MRRFLFALGVLALTGCGSVHTSAPTRAAGDSTAGTTTGSVPTAPSHTPRCAASGLAVWIGLGEGGATAGSTFYPLELTNVSSHTCHLFGFPGASAFAGHQLGSPAQRNHTVAEHTVTLVPGDTAHTVVQISDVGNFSRSQCAPVTAFGLKVIPPDETTSKGVPFSFRACSKAGPIFLTVQPAQPGVGVPGYPNL
ncbi:MAG: DUF4232 domain-containing protein [Gaiellaceae bacterium]